MRIQRKSNQRWIAFGLGIALPLVLLAAWAMIGGDRGATSGEAAGVHDAVKGVEEGVQNFPNIGTGGEGGPCMFSHRLNKADPFDGITSVPHWYPHTDVASRALLEAAWSCAADVVVLEFRSGVDVYLEPGWGTVPNPGEKWTDMAAEPDGGDVLEVRGAPALVTEPGASHPRGGVLVIDGGTLVRVLGNGNIPAAGLVRVANSMS